MNNERVIYHTVQRCANDYRFWLFYRKGWLQIGGCGMEEIEMDPLRRLTVVEIRFDSRRIVIHEHGPGHWRSELKPEVRLNARVLRNDGDGRIVLDPGTDR
jgi:hypothetical protein